MSRPTWRVRRLRSDHLSVHTSDGGPYAAGGRNGGCHGVARGAPADGRRHGIGGSRGNAPNPDRGRPTEPARPAPKASMEEGELKPNATTDGGPYAGCTGPPPPWVLESHV